MEVAFSPSPEDWNVDMDDFKALLVCPQHGRQPIEMLNKPSRNRKRILITEPKSQDSELEIVCSCMFHQRSQVKPTSLPSLIVVHIQKDPPKVVDEEEAQVFGKAVYTLEGGQVRTLATRKRGM